ncbi:MAG: ribonucleoside-diphosphate reductase subunit alpha [Alphaproteobacteria bacterium]|nr:ribonucleoside-diphosphate reductase subunit alpha [Alphaproteobacteria bacterium]
MAAGNITVDYSRDKYLTDFGRATLDDRYLLPGEKYQDLFARVAGFYADDDAHAARIYDYISRMWFMPATPILSNGGTTTSENKARGLPISCFLNETEDSLQGIVDLWNENVWLASRGGGIGSYWGNLRALGEKVGRNGKTSGVVPFVRVQDSLTLAISQGSLRRGSSAVYLDISHPEIEEFIDIRRPTGGDPNRKALNLHHGIAITDAFMEAVEKDEKWDLLSPKDKHVVETVKARDLWAKLLTTRIETGEPYIIFIDTVNRAIPQHHKEAGLFVKMSNLCSEITLPTGFDQHGKSRTAVCCLSSLNVEYFDEWKAHPTFVEDVMRFLDNVLQDFIDTAPESMARAKYSAMRERSIGLGVMGFHSYLQSKMIPFESVMAKVWNKKMFEHVRKAADAASLKLGEERGPCPDAAEFGSKERFSNKMAIAPTASISIICGNASPGIEPYAANAFTQKTLSGSFQVRNKYLKALLAEKGRDTDDIWSQITTQEGSVQQMDFLDDNEKLVFKTAYEMDQRWVVEHSADRAPFVCQAQSTNLFLPANIHKRDLHMLHFMAWKKGVKSLYYCRSASLQRSDKVSSKSQTPEIQLEMSLKTKQASTYEECLACQ